MEHPTPLAIQQPTTLSWPLVAVFAKLFTVVFTCFFSFGAAIAVIPLYIKTELHFGSFIIGAIVALQYLATLLSRGFAGSVADTVGAKIAVRQGLVAALLCGVMYLISTYLHTPLFQLIVIAIGRVSLGIAESLLVTGALAWALKQVGSAHAGKIMAWNGNAMYGGVALGALGGSWLVSYGGFLWVAYAAIALPIAVSLLAYQLPNQTPSQGIRLPFYQVIQHIALPGTGLFLATVGYGVILTYIGLFFQANDWSGSAWAIASFGGAYVIARLLFSGFPDRFGGARVALFFLLIETLGLILVCSASQKITVFLGASLSGFGFSLVVPSLGIEAIRRIPSQNRGAAMGGFLAFFDLSFCLAIPFAGALAKGNNYTIVYFVGAVCALMSSIIAWLLIKKKAVESITSDYCTEP